MAIKRTIAEFLLPGSFVAEINSRVVDTRDLDKLEIPDRSFGVTFYDQHVQEVEVDLEIEPSGRKSLFSKSFNKETILFGVTYTPEQIEAINTEGKFDTLLANARGNGWKGAVLTRMGNWQPWEADTKVVQL